MFENNGIVYASAPASGMKVVSARVTNDLSMLVVFTTGETRLLDATVLLKYPAFAKLADPAVFAGFSIDHGVLCWLSGEIDIAPERLYELSYSYDSVA